MRLPAIPLTPRFLRILLGFLICELALFFLLVFRQESVITSLRKDISDKKDLLVRYSHRVREISSLEATLASMKTQLSNLELDLPPIQCIPTFLLEVENLGRASGVKIMNLTPQAKETPPPTARGREQGEVERGTAREAGAKAPPKTVAPSVPFDFVGINMEVEGTLQGIYKFLSGFRNFPKVVFIDRLEVTPQEKEGVTMLRLGLSLKIATAREVKR